MVDLRHLARAALVLWALHLPAAAADGSTDSGRKIFERRCQTCHQGSSPPDSAIGPSLVGIVGRKAGTGSTGVHSRAMIEADMVWTRGALRRFLSDPKRETPGTLMPVQVDDPKELDDLLDYLESLR